MKSKLLYCYYILVPSLLILLQACGSEEASDEKTLIPQKDMETADEIITKTDSRFFSDLAFLQQDSLQQDSIRQQDSLANLSLPTPEMKLLLFEEAGKYGFKNEDGEVVLEAQYAMANDFINGIAEVVDQEGWVYINGHGKIVARPFIMDNGPDYFKGGLARFVEDEKIGFLNEEGLKTIPAEFDFALPFNSGLSAACMGCKKEAFVTESGEHFMMSGGNWGFINKKGNWVVPCKYEEVRSFNNGIGAYLENDKWVEIDTAGEIQ